MKVKCIKLLNADGKEVEFSPWLTLGREYHVMGIEVKSSVPDVNYRIITNDKEPGFAAMVLIQSSAFMVTSEIVPSNWRLKIYKEAGFEISPLAWQEPEFLEKFYEGDPDVYPIYERERDVIMREDS